MFKRWMRSEPYQLPGGGWVPVAQMWEETPTGAVERVRLVGKPDVTAATEEEARACAAALARRWLAGGASGEDCCGSDRLPAVRRP
jgi:hypothetical protein